jgi:FAD synthase
MGKVIKGKGRGKDLGYPTANLEVSPLKLLPPAGVYAVWVILNGEN